MGQWLKCRCIFCVMCRGNWFESFCSRSHITYTILRMHLLCPLHPFHYHLLHGCSRQTDAAQVRSQFECQYHFFGRHFGKFRRPPEPIRFDTCTGVYLVSRNLALRIELSSRSPSIGLHSVPLSALCSYSNRNEGGTAHLLGLHGPYSSITMLTLGTTPTTVIQSTK